VATVIVEGALPAWQRVLVVVAHPDDESFGLGALVDRFAQAGAEVSVLCLTGGEASTLGVEHLSPGELAAVRAEELRAAAKELGVTATLLRDHPDGTLSDPELRPALEADIAAAVDHLSPGGLLVFDQRAGVTGHPDHAAASLAAVAVARRAGLPVLGWALPESVSQRLNTEFGAGFGGYVDDELIAIPVERTRQAQAVRCHTTQAVPGSVLWRRLELLGDHEYVRHLT
jgi:LmbE family N-acetylglucosaminyl deacetylase